MNHLDLAQKLALVYALLALLLALRSWWLDEDTNEESRAMTVYEAMGDTSVELFLEVQDDDVGYEVEDYDPEA